MPTICSTYHKYSAAKINIFQPLNCRKNFHVQHWTRQVCDIFWQCNDSLLEHSIFSFLSFLFPSFKLTSFSCAWGRRQLIKAEFLFTDKFRRQASSEVPWISCIPTTFFSPLSETPEPHTGTRLTLFNSHGRFHSSWEGRKLFPLFVTIFFF